MSRTTECPERRTPTALTVGALGVWARAFFSERAGRDQGSIANVSPGFVVNATVAGKVSLARKEPTYT